MRESTRSQMPDRAPARHRRASRSRAFAPGILAGALAVAAMIVPAEAGAQGLGTVAPGEWVETDGGRIRLVLGGAAPDGSVEAALDIDLEPGWKTYWLAPGPSGIPPQIDARRSENLELVAFDLPAPHHFEDVYGMSTGYKDDVAFPLTFRVTEPGRPARLALDGFLGICEEICIPVPVAFEGEVAQGMSTPFDTGRVLREARLALPIEGAEGALAARLENDALALDGPALEGASEVYVAPPGSLSLGEGRGTGTDWRFPVLRGQGEGEAVVIVRKGEGAFARETIHRVAIERR